MLLLMTDIKSQVTIGTSSSPINGALLQLKETNDIDSNATKGLALPRVPLQNFNSLLPCAENTPANQSAHKGLTVYNTTESGIFKAGMYVWDGTSWQNLLGPGYQGFGPWYKTETEVPAFNNTDDSYLMGKVIVGGKSVIANSSLSVIGNSIINGKIGINKQTEPTADLDLDGTLRLKNLSPSETIEVGSVLQAKNNNGDVEWVKNISTPRMLFIESDSETSIPNTTFNKNNTTLYSPTFSLSARNTALNTIGAKFDADGKTIIIKNGGIYEIAGYLNYFHDDAFFDSSSTKIRFNLIVRLSTDNGNTWKDIAGARFTLFKIVNNVSLQTLTASLPSHIIDIPNNAYIQYEFVKVSTDPSEELKGGKFIVAAKADGMNYSSSLKLTKL